VNDKQRETCRSKDPYDSRDEAERMARLMTQTTTSGQLWVYECPVCEGFHLTSKPPREDE